MIEGEVCLADIGVREVGMVVEKTNVPRVECRARAVGIVANLR